MSWTDERVSTLKKLWLDGLSASQIAKQLGGVTRNAVIGKVHRLGLSGRAAPSQPSRPVFKAPRPARPARSDRPLLGVGGPSPRLRPVRTGTKGHPTVHRVNARTSSGLTEANNSDAPFLCPHVPSYP